MPFMSLIYVIFVIAAFSLCYWALTQFTLPQPVKVVLILILGLIGLGILWNLFVGSGGLHLAR